MTRLTTDEQLTPAPTPVAEAPAYPDTASQPITRRSWLQGAGALALAAGGAGWLWKQSERMQRSATFISRANDYDASLESLIREGLVELGFGREMIRDKSVMLKPNLVEPTVEAPHINTHPAVVRAAAEVFRRWDAREVFVAEGQGHIRDGWLVLGTVRAGTDVARGIAGVRRFEP